MTSPLEQVLGPIETKVKKVRANPDNWEMRIYLVEIESLLSLVRAQARVLDNYAHRDFVAGEYEEGRAEVGLCQNVDERLQASKKFLQLAMKGDK